MATAYADVVSIGNFVDGGGGQWYVPSGGVAKLGSQHVRQPTVPDPAVIDPGDPVYANGGNGTMDVGFAAAVTGTVSSVTVWFYGNVDKPTEYGEFIDLAVSPDGTTFGTPVGTSSAGELVDSWFSVTFPVSWTAAQANAMVVRFHQIDSNYNIAIRAIYAVLTYTAGAVASSGTFLMAV